MKKILNIENARWVIFFILSAIGFLIYGHVLHGEFQFDDATFIVRNDHIHDLKNIPSIWSAYPYPTRFITFLSFAVNFYLGGLDPFGYHLLNVLIHIINAALIFGLVQLICTKTSAAAVDIKENSLEIAFVAALIFLVHPLQTQAVSYVSQRFASLTTLFYLLTVYLFLKARVSGNSRKLFLAAFVSGVLAMFSKEIAFTLPMMLLVADYCLVLNQGQREKFKEEVPWRYIFILCFLLIIPFLFNFDYTKIFNSRSVGNSESGVVSSGTYLLTQFRVIPYYLWLFLCPGNLNLDYDFALSRSFFEPDVLAGLLLIVALIFWAMRLLKHQPLYSFCLLWFFIALSVEASIIPIPHVIFEHRMYLPSFGLCFLFAVCFYRIFKAFKLRWFLWGLMVVVLGVLTYERNKVWQTEIALWSDCVKKSPYKSRPYDNLAAALIKKGYTKEAKPYLLESLRLGSNDSATKVNLAQIYAAEKNTEAAKTILLSVIKKYPRYTDALNNLALIYMDEKDYPQAEFYLKAAIAKRNLAVEPLLNLALLYRRTENPQAAIELLSNASLRLQDERLLFLLLEIALSQKEMEKAKEVLAIIHRYTHEALFWRNVGSLCAMNGLKEDALYAFLSAIKISPRYDEVYIELGKLWANSGDMKKAILVWEKGAQLSGNREKFEPLIEQAKKLGL